MYQLRTELKIEVLRKSKDGARRAAVNAAFRAQDVITAGAQKYAPVDKGYLWSKIEGKAKGPTFESRSDAPYAGHQEWGTRYQKGTAHMRPALADADLHVIFVHELRKAGVM